jgi:hypothetical protein
MPLTSEQGYKIREEYSSLKEKKVCDSHGLIQTGGPRTKIDGFNENSRKSIKNASGNSTQVHLTTQKYFIEILNIFGNSVEFIKHFCGNQNYNYKGRDRRFIKEIDLDYVNSFKQFLDENKEKIIDLIVRNGFDITHVVYRDIKNNVEYELTYEQILDKIKEAEWVFLRGGVHLKLNKKSFFHFQREGKRSKNKNGKYTNRYNVLWHIHRNLFQ